MEEEMVFKPSDVNITNELLLDRLGKHFLSYGEFDGSAMKVAAFLLFLIWKDQKSDNFSPISFDEYVDFSYADTLNSSEIEHPSPLDVMNGPIKLGDNGYISRDFEKKEHSINPSLLEVYKTLLN